jgi:hypothetical protein
MAQGLLTVFREIPVAAPVLASGCGCNGLKWMAHFALSGRSLYIYGN